MRLVVCGGAGYVGSHMCRLLAQHGHELLVVDNLSTGHAESVQGMTLRQANIGDTDVADNIKAFRPDAVFHFAGKSIVDQSAMDPGIYYVTNVAETINLLEQVRKLPNCAFIFSSTAAIYGYPTTEFVSEQHPCMPISPYGRSKLTIEHLLRDYWDAYQLPSATFRYFNAAGADPSGQIGESHTPETHLIPRLLEYALDRSDRVRVYGRDYETIDGTCVRDYIHVNDLCQAHLLGLQFLLREPGTYAFNLGSGNGFSVAQVIHAVEQVLGRRIEHEVVARRTGDPSRLVADSTLARTRLGWQPQFMQIEEIMETAWLWHRSRRY